MKTNNYKVTVKGMLSHISKGNKESVFASYEKALNYFIEHCDLHNIPIENILIQKDECLPLSAGGIGYDYRIELEIV